MIKNIIEKEILTLSDVAKIANTSNSNISNWRKKDEKFPIPYKETTSGPIWKAEDIAVYLSQKYEGNDIIAKGKLKSKRVAILGRARVGKSFLASRFVEDKKGFTQIFCKGGADKTKCPIYINISEDIISDEIEFHTNFNSIIKEYDDNLVDIISKEEYEKLVYEISVINNGKYNIYDLEKIEKIEKIIDKINSIKKEYKGLKNLNNYINVYVRPSEFSKEILRECEISKLELVDTPGVSGKVEMCKIEKADLYIIVLRDDNEEEAKTLSQIATAIKAEVATSKVAFLYRYSELVDEEDEYKEAKEEVKNNMHIFSENFEELRDNIISTDLELLNPDEHCILFPTMKKEKFGFTEKMFLIDMKEKIKNAFDENKDEQEDKIFIESIKNNSKAKELIIGIMSNIDKYNLNESGCEYNINDFESEKHNRVMTGDNYRIEYRLMNVYKEELKHLENYFSKFKMSSEINFGEDKIKIESEWQAIIIKGLYRKITKSIRNDRGIGIGTHPFEVYPARTMLVEESIIADKLYKLMPTQNDIRTYLYIEELKKCNISSETWNYVKCENSEEGLKKLEIISKCLTTLKVDSLENMIRCRYIGGLRKIAQYNILRDAGFGEEESMEIVKELAF